MMLRKARSGQALVELALVLVVLVPVLFGILELGRVLDAWIIATNTAREGARYAAVGKPSGEVVALSLAYLDRSLAGRTDVTFNAGSVTVANAGGIPGTPVQVSVNVGVHIITPLFQAIAADPFPVGGTAIMKLE